MREDEAVALLDRAAGMLLHLWGLIADPPTRAVIRETIEALNDLAVQIAVGVLHRSEAEGS